MPDTTLAKIKARQGGIPEEVAREFHAKVGTTRMAIVELQSTSRSEDLDGQETAHITILGVEVADPGRAEDILRRMQRALYQSRSEVEGQAAIDETLAGERLSDVLDESERSLLGDED